MRVTTLIKAITLTALLVGTSVAGVKYVAVVETDVDAQSGASAILNPAEVRQVTAELRRVAVENLPRDKYNIMTSETVQSMGGAVLEECADENCVITLGSRIGADYIVRGIISKLGARLTLSVEMYETENGTLVASLDPVRSQNIEELVERMAGACGEMYRKFAGPQTKAQTVAETQSMASYTPNTYNNRYSKDQYNDFTIGQRFGTWGLNVLPGGLGSFIVMKDNVGGKILLEANGLAIIGGIVMAYYNNHSGPGGENVMIAGLVTVYVGICGAGIFNIYRSITYHKPYLNSSANANIFKPYDGLKLAIVPTESGDYKVIARYNYTF